MNTKLLIGATAAIASIALLSSSAINAPDKDPQVLLKTMEDIPTVQAFLKDPVPEADLLRIVNAGINSPSGMNKQPWHFTVINNADEIAKLAEAQKSSMKFPPMPPQGMDSGERPAPPQGMGPGERPAPPQGMGPGNGQMPQMPSGNRPKSGLGDSPVVIVISCNPGSEFDAGLACECMNDMANLLGYGTKIVASVTLLFNGENKAEYYQKFQVPEGQNIVAAILLGKVDDKAYDAVTSATPRNSFESVVSFVK